MNIIYQVSYFLITFAFSIVSIGFILRILFQLFRAPTSNPVYEALIKLTEFLIAPLRKFIPKTRYIDLSTLIVWLIIDLFKYVIITYMSNGQMIGIGLLLVVIPCDFVMQSTMILFYAVIFHVILKFVASGMNNAGTQTLAILSEPALRIGRQFIPATSGFDFSPIVVIVCLKVIQIIITSIIPPSYFF